MFVSKSLERRTGIFHMHLISFWLTKRIVIKC